MSSGFLSLMHAKTHASSALASSTLILMHAPCRFELWLAHARVYTASVYNTVHTRIGAVSRPWSRRTDVLRGAFDKFRTIVNPSTSWQRLKRRPQKTCCARLSMRLEGHLPSVLPQFLPGLVSLRLQAGYTMQPFVYRYWPLKKAPYSTRFYDGTRRTSMNPGQGITQGRVSCIAAALSYRQQLCNKLPRRWPRSSRLFPSRQPPCVRRHAGVQRPRRLQQRLVHLRITA